MASAPSSSPESLPRPRGLPLATPFFYGWVIVACVAAASFLASGTTNVVISVLLKPINEETGWSRTMISSALGAGALASGLLSPASGWLADRFGGRALLAIAGALCGSLYLVVAQALTFPLFLVSYAANRAIAWSSLAGVVGQATVANWFAVRRPRALGAVGMAGALGGSAMAILAQFLLDRIGWRGVMMTYGVLTLLLVVAPCALLVRRRPEDVGLTQDGMPPEQAGVASATPDKRTRRGGPEYHWSLSQAMQTPALWLITASGSVALFGVSGVSVHQIAYFTDRGIPAEAAAGVLAVYTFSSAVAALMWGFLTERFDERTMSVISLLFAAACVWFLTTVDTAGGAFLFAAMFGVCARGQNTLVSIVFAQYYGRTSFGAISGFAMLFQTCAAAAGPLAAAYAFDTAGTYVGEFYLLIGVFLLASVLMFSARRPIPPLQDVPPEAR